MAKKGTPSKAELKAYYDDNGWKETISKYRISPTNLSELLGKSKAKKKAKKKAAKKKASATKRKPGRPRKTDGPKKRGPGRPKKTELKKNPKKKVKAAKAKGKGGRRANPLILIRKIEENTAKLKKLIAAA